VQLLLSLVCDNASQDREGRLHIEGQYLDLYAPGFPAKHNLTLVMVMGWSHEDHGRYAFTMELVGPDGKPSLRGEGHTEVSTADPAGPAPRTYYVQHLEDVVFPTAGEYRIRVRVKGRWTEGPVLYLWETAESEG